MKNFKKNLPVILLISAIALSPGFAVGEIGGGKIAEIRIEDFLLLILGLVWIANFFISGKKKVKKPPLFFPILVWLAVGALSTLTNLIFTTLNFDRAFFYFLKEIEFFVFYFYIFYHIRNTDSAKFLIKVWIFLGAVNVLYVVYQMIVGSPFDTGWGLRSGEYGAAAVGEWGVFPSGAFFLIIFVFLINLFLYYFLSLNISKVKKAILGVLAVSPALGVFGSASNTNFLGLVFALSLTLFFLFLRKRNFKLILLAISILIFMAIIFILALENIRFVTRLLVILSPSHIPINYLSGRIFYWFPIVETILEYPLFSLLLGAGKGFIGEAHNQYLRNFAETGVIGSIAFLFLIFVILKLTFKTYSKEQDPFCLSLSAGFLVATLTMLFLSLATEPFIVVKCSSVYWSFAAITMAVLSFKARERKRLAL